MTTTLRPTLPTRGGGTVATVMTRCPVSVPADAPAAAVVAVLAPGRIGAVPVLDHRGVPIGVVTDADLLRVPVVEGRRARDVMSGPVRTVDIATPVTAVSRLLLDLRRVFVTEHGRLVGVVSRRDLLADLLADDDIVRAAVEAALSRWHDRVTVHVHDGVVFLLGRVEWRSERAAVVDRARAVAGVGAVRDRLGYTFDDRRARH